MLGPEGTRPTHMYLLVAKSTPMRQWQAHEPRAVRASKLPDAVQSQVFALPSFKENHVVTILQLANLATSGRHKIRMNIKGKECHG